jgi:hypothetical protein
MRSRPISIFAVAFGILTICAPLLAHHGTSAFDMEKPITLKGTVTDWFWANPHCLLGFDVKTDDGQVAHWIGETQNPRSMSGDGWSKQSFKPGDEITIILFSAKNGKLLGQIKQVVLPNGSTLIAIKSQ